MDEITNFISSIGFPITMCIYMVMYNNKTIEKLSNTIAQNTIVLEKILTKLGDDVEE